MSGLRNCLKALVFPIGVAAVLTSCVGTDQNSLAAQEQLECRSFKMTGSNIPKKICATAAEWEANDRAEAEGVDQFIRDSNANSTVTDGNAAFPAAGPQ